MREVSALLTDNRLVSVTTNNSAGAVDFDFWLVWEKWKEKRFKSLTMIHTHPSGMNQMSSIDANMIDGWIKAFPIPLLFVVVAGNDPTFTTVYLGYKKEKVISKFILGEIETDDQLISDLWQLSKAESMDIKILEPCYGFHYEFTIYSQEIEVFK